MYVGIAIAFGWIDWAAISASIILIITVVTYFIGHTAAVSAVAVFMAVAVIHNYDRLTVKWQQQSGETDSDKHIYTSLKTGNADASGSGLYL